MSGAGDRVPDQPSPGQANPAITPRHPAQLRILGECRPQYEYVRVERQQQHRARDARRKDSRLAGRVVANDSRKASGCLGVELGSWGGRVGEAALRVSRRYGCCGFAGVGCRTPRARQRRGRPHRPDGDAAVRHQRRDRCQKPNAPPARDTDHGLTLPASHRTTQHNSDLIRSGQTPWPSLTDSLTARSCACLCSHG